MRLFGSPNVEKMKNVCDVKGLIKALRDEKDDVVRQAAEALGQIEAVAAALPLIAALERRRHYDTSDTANARRAVVRALGQIGDVRAVKPLIVAIRTDSLRAEAADALVRIGTPAIEPLVAALRDEDSNVRRAAAGALDKMAWRPGRDESAAAYGIAERQWDKYIGLGAPAVDPLISELRNNDIDTEVSDVGPAVAHALGEIGDVRAVEPLIAAWGYRNRNVGPAVAHALGQIGAVRSVEPLIYWLKRRDEPALQVATAEALVRIGTPAVAPLIAALAESSTARVRLAEVDILSQIGDTRAVAPLITALNDEDINVRLAAADALDKIGWPPAQDPNDAVYWVARKQWEKCITVGTAAVGPLIDALGAGDSIVRQAAGSALAEIGTPAVVPPIAALTDRQPGSATHAGRFSRRDVAGVMYLESEAAEVLVKIGEPVVEALIAVLTDNDSDGSQAAAYASGQSGAARAVETLKARVNHEATRSAVARVLLRLGDLRGLDIIRAGLATKREIDRDDFEAVLQFGTKNRTAVVLFLEEVLKFCKNSYHRGRAAEHLLRLGEHPARKDIVSVILDLLSDKSPCQLQEMVSYVGMDAETVNLGRAALGKDYRTTKEWIGPSLFGGVEERIYYYSNSSVMDAVTELCRRQDIWSSCVLFLVTSKTDVTFELETREAPWSYTASLSCEEEREAARRELGRRGFGNRHPLNEL